MYITCEQCSTIFRLDESRLKPSGSKVRCSECLYIFVATPPEPVVADVAASGAAVALAERPVTQQDVFDQELEGIDLAELDSILEQGRISETTTALIDQDDFAEADELVEFDEADLALDFENALEPEEDTATESDAGDQAPDLEAEDLDLDLDLDMDFDLDAGDDVPVQPPAAEEEPFEADLESFEADLNMAFELDEDTDESAVAQAPSEDIATEEGDLTEDVELALDDFEDVLGQPDDIDEAGLVPDAAHEEEPELAMDEEAEAPGAGVESVTEEAAAEPVGDDSDGLDLVGDLDSLLDEEEGEEAEELDLEDVELSLDDDAAEAVGEAADLVMEAGQETEAALTPEAGDDLDLSGFGDLLDETDEDLAVTDEEPEDIELSLDDDFELSLDEGPAAEPAAAEAVSTGDISEAGDDFDLTGLDDLLAEKDETVDEATPEELELSLDDDLDLSLDEEATALDMEADLAAEDTADKAGDDFDLPGGLDDLFAEEDETVDEALAQDLELYLDDDLELSLDEETPAPALEGGGGDAQVEADREEFDLSDFEDLLGEDAAPAGEEDFLDFSGLDEETEEQEPEKGGAEEDLELELDDGISLTLDEEPSLDLAAEAPTETVAEEGQDDFDLSGFGDDLLDSDLVDSMDDSRDDSKETPADDLELTLDDDLELSMDDVTETETASDTGAEDDLGELELEDLDFEIDAEFEDKPISRTSEALEADDVKPADTVDGEIDLTDIEKMLEDDTIVPETAAATTDFELDLDADGAEKWVDEGGEDLGLGGEDEIDLTELVEAIDSADTDAKGAAPVNDAGELELDLHLEPEEPESADESEDLVLEMEDESPLEMTLEDEDVTLDGKESDDLDLSDFDLSIEEKPSGQTETIDAGDIQLEFQVEDQKPIELEGEVTIGASAITAASAETTDFFLDEEDFSAEETITTGPIQAKRKLKRAPAPKKKGGGGKILIFVLILALLGAGGYFGYDYVVKNNIVIPYLSDYINPEAKDPSGVANLSTMDINSMFIDNEAAGRLFVVKGKVRNGYTNTRKMIRLSGKLYTKGKVSVKTEYVYAGLVVPEKELSSKPIAEIKKRLVSTSGQAAAITAATGQTLPFMVVFNDLPEDLDEFEIELVSSTKVQ